MSPSFDTSKAAPVKEANSVNSFRALNKSIPVELAQSATVNLLALSTVLSMEFEGTISESRKASIPAVDAFSEDTGCFKRRGKHTGEQVE